MAGKTCLVTGGAGGIGRETAAGLARLGADVMIVGRTAASGVAAAEAIRARAPEASVRSLAADLSSLAEVRRLATDVLATCDRLDVLVNNAGVIMRRRQLTVDGLETTLAVNHLAPFLLTGLLRGLLVQSGPARVVTVASAAHRQVRTVPWDDLPAGVPEGQAYPVSKLLNILFTRELARRLDGTGVTANCLHPGFVRSALGRDVTGVMGAVVRLAVRFRPGPEKGAETSVYLASSPAVAGVTGGYFVDGAPVEPSALARDDEAAARLWTLSEKLVGG